jgi:hypothetical protein
VVTLTLATQMAEAGGQSLEPGVQDYPGNTVRLHLKIKGAWLVVDI